MTPEQRQQRARIGGYALAASHDPMEYTAAARTAFLAKFEVQVDPEFLLSESERQRRALAARRAYFSNLALQRSMKKK